MIPSVNGDHEKCVAIILTQLRLINQYFVLKFLGNKKHIKLSHIILITGYESGKSGMVRALTYHHITFSLKKLLDCVKIQILKLASCSLFHKIQSSLWTVGQ